MLWQDWFFVFGTLFFAFSFVLLIVLIIGAILILKNLNKLQMTLQEAMEEKKSLTSVLPALLIAALEAKTWYRRLRYPRY